MIDNKHVLNCRLHGFVSDVIDFIRRLRRFLSRIDAVVVTWQTHLKAPPERSKKYYQQRG